MESSDNSIDPKALGGYFSFSDHPDTVYMGISRNEYPDWYGWPVVDLYMPIHPGAFINNRYLEQMVQEFYIDHPIIADNDNESTP